MKPSQIWAFQKAGIICLNTYLIFSLNFVAIFAHGTPDQIHDNIHSSHKQRYRDHRHHHSGAGDSDSPDSTRQGSNVKLWKARSPSDDTLRIGTSSYSFNSRSSSRGKQVIHNRPYKDDNTALHSGRNSRSRLSDRISKSKTGENQSIRRKANKSNNKHLLPTKPVSPPSLTRKGEVNHHAHFLPAQEIGYRDPGDTIDLSKIGGDSSFEISVDDIKPSRLRVTPEELLKNSIDRFDAFGDYEYIDVEQHPQKVEFHRPLRKRPPDLRRIDDSIYDPYLWERRRPTQKTTVRRVDDGYSQVRFPASGNRLYGRRRQTKIQPHPNHNYNPQVPLQTSLSRPPYQTRQYFSPNYNPLHYYSGARKPSRRKDAQRFGNGGLRPIQQFQDTFSYHDPLTKLPASYFQPTTPKPSKGIFGSILNLAGFDDKSTNTDYYHNTNAISARPGGSKGGILSLLFGSKEDDLEYPEYLDTYNPPYGQPGYTDYDYGDYNEGVGLYPPKKLSVPQRVAKWFSGFKIPSSKRRRFGGPRRPGERITLGHGHSPYPLDYDYYDTGDDQNLIFYGHHNHIGQKPPLFGGAGIGGDDLGSHFSEVTEAIKNNSTGVDIATKILSIAAKLTERSSDSNSLFMMWTIPTTILALMGIVYFVGALAIVGYKYSLFFNGDANQAVNLIPIVIAFSLPLIFGILLVSGRASLNGQLDVSRVMKGDFSRSMRSDFDGVDFTLDGVFGSFGLLGLAWLASVTI